MLSYLVPNKQLEKMITQIFIKLLKIIQKLARRRSNKYFKGVFINRLLRKALLLPTVLALCWIIYSFSSFRQDALANKNEGLISTELQYKLNRTDVAAYVEKLLEESLKLDKGMRCDIPYLDPFSEEAVRHDYPLPPLSCEEQGWVKCYFSKCRILDAVRDIEDIKCEFRDIIYLDDNRVRFGPGTMILKDDVYELNASDHVSIACLGTSRKSGNMEMWRGSVPGLRPLETPHPPPGREHTPNVLILLFDSTSRSGFIRLMPESLKVLVNELGATVMNGFNIVGDGTCFAMFPLLTGHAELELPDVRVFTFDRHKLEELPFIFYKLKGDGYRTAFFEDLMLPGAFQSRIRGFESQPTDHYLQGFRNAYLKQHKTKWNYCLGDTPQFKVMMNLTEQFFELEGKRFAVTCITDISHNNHSLIRWADADTAAFLRRMMKWADDTLIMVMGDHGPRYSLLDRGTRTIRGKLDERLPFLALRLPARLRARRQRALEHNARALVTVHDLHATLLDVLDMQQHWNPYKVPGAYLTRGLTLLEPIPLNRSCSEAGIGTHWCSCLVWQPVNESAANYNKSAVALIDYINMMLRPAKSRCIPRYLDSIRWVNRQRANKYVLSYAGALNFDSYLGSFNSSTNITTESYQIGIVAGPGQAVYEASLTYNVKEDRFLVLITDISRTDPYKGQSDCILRTHPHLAAYCYCVDNDWK